MESDFIDVVNQYAEHIGVLPVYRPESGDAPSEPHIILSVIDTEPDTKGMSSGWSVYQWILQISIYFKNGESEIKLRRVVDQLRAAFPYGKKLITDCHEFQVVKPGRAASPLSSQRDGWKSIPVRFRLQTIN